MTRLFFLDLVNFVAGDLVGRREVATCDRSVRYRVRASVFRLTLSSWRLYSSVRREPFADQLHFLFTVTFSYFVFLPHTTSTTNKFQRFYKLFGRRVVIQNKCWELLRPRLVWQLQATPALKQMIASWMQAKQLQERYLTISYAQARKTCEALASV